MALSRKKRARLCPSLTLIQKQEEIKLECSRTSPPLVVENCALSFQEMKLFSKQDQDLVPEKRIKLDLYHFVFNLAGRVRLSNSHVMP